jgi:ribonuclease PH
VNSSGVGSSGNSGLGNTARVGVTSIADGLLPSLHATSPRIGRAPDALRDVTLERNAVRYAEGSCLVSFGGTRVLCAASVEDGVPGWKRGRGEGWITAEYAMLPRATRTRSSRERQQIGGRTQEIQRLIGRSVRAMLDDFRFGEFTLKVDCDVLEADGGTRTASITGACIAVCDAFDWLVSSGRALATPVKRRVAAVSVGVVDGEPRLDLDYEEDVRAGVDMNVVMSSEMRFVEVQGTGEHGTFDRGELDALLDLAIRGIRALDAAQVAALSRA